MAKKNQHYIPKFYLRNFSYCKDQKQIGIYNINNEIFNQKVPLKSQASKDFFYGKDEIVENTLAKLEGSLATTINKIIKTKVLDKKDEVEFQMLLTFMILTDLRNPLTINNFKDFPARFNSLKLGIQMPGIPHEQSVAITLSTIAEIIPTVLDLDYKMFYNISSTPFIASDFPILKYNILYEFTPTIFSVCGYASKGILIFMCVNPKLCIAFFDKSIYKIGNNKENVVKISNSKEVDQLNLLTVLSCESTLFFNEKISKDYIEDLVKKSAKYAKANIPNIFTTELLSQKKHTEQSSLILSRNSDTKIKLNINSIKIHSGNRIKPLDPTKLNLRNKYR